MPILTRTPERSAGVRVALAAQGDWIAFPPLPQSAPCLYYVHASYYGIRRLIC